jgi:hypothetical protein
LHLFGLSTHYVLKYILCSKFFVESMQEISVGTMEI